MGDRHGAAAACYATGCLEQRIPRPDRAAEALEEAAELYAECNDPRRSALAEELRQRITEAAGPWKERVDPTVPAIPGNPLVVGDERYVREAEGTSGSIREYHWPSRWR